MEKEKETGITRRSSEKRSRKREEKREMKLEDSEVREKRERKKVEKRENIVRVRMSDIERR